MGPSGRRVRSQRRGVAKLNVEYGTGIINDDYYLWCLARGVQHAHCPDGCDHPQPILADDGELYCGRCWVQDRVKSRMVPCTPEACD